MKPLLLLVSLLTLSASAALATEAPKSFQRMDANRDGQIDAQEWLAKGKKDAQRADKPFDEAKLLKRMARLDRNGDKKLSVEELQAPRGQKKPAADKIKKKN